MGLYLGALRRRSNRPVPDAAAVAACGGLRRHVADSATLKTARRKVANAHRKGGSAEALSEAERAAIGEIAAALGATNT
jgi:hypothetical protein